MLPVKKEIRFSYSKLYRKRLGADQMMHLQNIERHYLDLYKKCSENVDLVTSGTHREWIHARVKIFVSESVIRLLFLVEAFCDAAKRFNGPAAASLIKSIVEIPMYLGHLLWIIRKHNCFDDVRRELDKINFGNRDPKTGLTSTGRVNGKDLSLHAQEMFDEIFPPGTEEPEIIARLYKESNATGHHNYEARMYTGRLGKDHVWRVSDRNEWFVFLTSKVFQIFLFCDAALYVTLIFINALEHEFRQMPDYLK